MKLSFTTLDVFTTKRYTGNPLALIHLPPSFTPTQQQKQLIASEFNLSETVFLHAPSPSSPSARKVDIFTAHAEVPFAGHPTIGTAFYLLHVGSDREIKTLVTKAGPIPIALDTATGEVNAEIPHNFHIHSSAFSSSLTSAVQHPVASIVNGMSFIYVSLPDLATLAKANGTLHPNTYDPSSLDEGWQNGILCTMYFVAQGVDETGRQKYRTRMFGSREDPGTGSASSGLACYLAGLEGKEGGVSKFAFEQGVEIGRKNEIGVEVVRGEGGGIEKVVLSGAAVVVMEGTIEV